MKRFTHSYCINQDDKKEIWVYEPRVKAEWNIHSDKNYWAGESISRLSAYEDTALSPAEVASLKTLYEAEKHRADVAEEALKEACIESIAYDNRIDNKNYVKLKRRAMYDRLIKQAEARLKQEES